MRSKKEGIIILPEQIDYALSVDAFERSLIYEALEKSEYNVAKASVLLNMNRTTLAMILKKKKIVVPKIKKTVDKEAEVK